MVAEGTSTSTALPMPTQPMKGSWLRTSGVWTWPSTQASAPVADNVWGVSGRHVPFEYSPVTDECSNQISVPSAVRGEKVSSRGSGSVATAAVSTVAPAHSKE